MDEAISWLGREASRYLKHKTDFISDDLSIDEFMEGIDDEDSTGFDPTATTKYEDSATLMMTLDMLLDDLAALDPQSAKSLHSWTMAMNGRSSFPYWARKIPGLCAY